MRSRYEQSKINGALREVAIDKLSQMGVKVGPASRSDYLARRINDVMSWDLGGDAMAVIRMFVAHKPADVTPGKYIPTHRRPYRLDATLRYQADRAADSQPPLYALSSNIFEHRDIGTGG
ncbi:hypothetical protein [Bordetella bronchiseptica]|uniref:hypothetical protein n=1 Tax=Bordetella bronchiseptica TaxID=518 RepID=UPI000528423A|nr:hypothetical protein [Bordetella bronchiseptica]AZW22932.1 hypothetical protein CS345_17250 [Bordetella bronchiseptica]